MAQVSQRRAIPASPDDRAWIFLRQPLPDFRGDRTPLVLGQEAEDVEESGAGEDALVGYAAERLLQERQQVELGLRSGREIHVAALGRDRYVLTAVPEQETLAEPRSGGDHGTMGGPGHDPC